MKEFLRDPIVGETREVLGEKGIEVILFDLDDTLIYTSEIFIRYMEEFAGVVAKETGIEVSLVMKALEEINNDEYKRMGVNPSRWSVVVERLAKELGGVEEIKKHLDILKQIYLDEPRTREGVKATLGVLKETGVKMGLVTHANVEWTYRKLNHLGLWNYFEEVVIVDENGHKKSEDWMRGIKGMGVAPENCLVVGDSLGGDIRPADEIGARTMWMPSPWSVYREGDVPEKTVQIGQISDLLSALGRLR